MSGARAFVAFLGIVIAVAGAVTAILLDRFIGIALVLIGGFLLTLPFTRPFD